MRTKIVFTVVGGEKDIYVPQALVAIYSARLFNPDANIVLVVDQDTALVIEKYLPKINNYVSDLIVVNVPSELSKMHRSRFLKTKLREIIEGDFLYIDTDTVISESLKEIDLIEANVAAVIDRHSVVNEHEYLDKIKYDTGTIGLTLEDLKNKYFNGGVMFVKDTLVAHNLYKKWHDNWKDSITYTRGIDQPPLALANKQCGYPIVELDGIWNCQLADNFLNYLADAKVLHYFASNSRSPYKLYSNAIFREVMKEGDVPLWLKERLKRPKSFFKPKHTLAYDDDVRFMMTSLHQIYTYHKRIFKVFETMSKLLIKKHL